MIIKKHLKLGVDRTKAYSMVSTFVDTKSFSLTDFVLYQRVSKVLKNSCATCLFMYEHLGLHYALCL